MDELFWTHQSDFPEGILGTPNFSPTHLTWLSVSIAIIVIAVLVLKKSGNPLRQGTQRVLIILAAVLEISRWIWAAIIGHYTVVEMLPFHLCSLSIWMEMAAVFSGKQLLKDFGASDAGLERVSALQFSIFTFRDGSLSFVSDPVDLGRQRRLPSEFQESSEVFRHFDAFRGTGFRAEPYLGKQLSVPERGSEGYASGTFREYMREPRLSRAVVPVGICYLGRFIFSLGNRGSYSEPSDFD